jgi:hypothetical protein
MAPPAKRPSPARIELITLLLLGAIATVVIVPRCQRITHNAPHPAESVPKQPGAKP